MEGEKERGVKEEREDTGKPSLGKSIKRGQLVELVNFLPGCKHAGLQIGLVTCLESMSLASFPQSAPYPSRPHTHACTRAHVRTQPPRTN